MKQNSELDLTASERIVRAITMSTLMFVGGIALIIMSPVWLIKMLLTKKKIDWEEVKKSLDSLGSIPDSDDGEDWKREHRKEYGD